MALLLSGDQDIDAVDAFTAIWEHYLAVRFVYPAKLERLATTQHLIRADWPRLLEAPADLFQFHGACRDGRIVSSICAFRDNLGTYVVEHAASQGSPQAMLQSILACLKTINADEEFAFAKMYFRPENRWPSRAARYIGEALMREFSAQSTQQYLVCDPALVLREQPAQRFGTEVVDLPTDDYALAYELGVATVGTLRARALGLIERDLTLSRLNQRFIQCGLRRFRRVLAIYRDGTLAGLALCHASSVPMNFSFLCGRTEILVHPAVEDRLAVITALARASIAEAAGRGEPLTALLIDPDDATGALTAGYTDTQTQYSCFLWARENSQGAPSALLGVERLYDTATRLATRNAPTASPEQRFDAIQGAS